MATVGHALHDPHAAIVVVFVSQPLAELPSQSAKPLRQVEPHDPLRQTDLLFAGTGHSAHEVPQLAVLVSLKHVVPQR